MEIILAVILTSALFIFLMLFQRKQFSKRFANHTNLVSVIEKLNIEVGELQEQLTKLTSKLNITSVELKNAEDTTNTLSSKQTELLMQIFDTDSNLVRSQNSFNEFNQKLIVVMNQYKTTTSSHQTLLVAFEKLKQDVFAAKTNLQVINDRTAHIQSLEKNVEALKLQEVSLNLSVDSLKEQRVELTKVMSRIDLYSRLDEFTSVGHFETPNYLYETSKRYVDEIKDVRDRQKQLIQSNSAIEYPIDFTICKEPALSRKILNGQINLLLNTFNIECDFLIEKVSPSSFSRTLEQIEKKAEALEKSCATLKCGFSIDYIKLKFEECKLQYEFKLKRQEEQEEQAIIREQMREEVRLQKEYEAAIKTAEEDEVRFRRLIEKAREELALVTGQEYAMTTAIIAELEMKLKEAQLKGARAKSLAEQTRRGFVYVISNLGAFGEDIYKIGLTRRLDPQERVDELGGASVPFRFDIHAVCFSEDAPALERALHKKFGHKRINAVNFRKEFFRVSLEEIQEALKELVTDEIEFKFAFTANDYYESRRLLTVS